MAFADRAVRVCISAMESGSVSEWHLKDVLRCKRVDTSPFEGQLSSPYPMVRRMAARIIGEKGGNMRAVLDAALKEDEKYVLLEMLSVVGRSGDGLEALEGLLEHEDLVIRGEAIAMFRRAKKAKLLFPLLFDEDDAVVHRIKRYINEQEEDTEDSGS